MPVSKKRARVKFNRARFEQLKAAQVEHLMAVLSRTRYTPTPAQLEDLSRRVSDRELLRNVYEVEVAMEAGEQRDVTTFGDRGRRLMITHPQPHPAMYREAELIRDAGGHDLFGNGAHSYSTGRRNCVRALLHFGDHTEQWYFNPGLFDLMFPDAPRRAHLMEYVEALSLAVAMGVRRLLADMIRRYSPDQFMQSLRGLLFNVVRDGFRIYEREHWQDFINLGAYPRPEVRTTYRVDGTMQRTRDARGRFVETVADQHPAIRRQYEQDPATFAEQVLGNWNPEHVEAEFQTRAARLGATERAVRNLGEAARRAGTTTATAAERLRRAFGSGVFTSRGVYDDGWFDHYTVDVEADRKAERLLLDHLTPEQRDEYMQLKRITVTAKSGRVYQVFRERTYNVTRLEGCAKTPPVEKLCVVTDTRAAFPIADVMLMQLILIRNDEETFYRTANKYPLDSGARHTLYIFDEAEGMPDNLFPTYTDDGT